MDDERSWYPYETGKTLGKRGPAGGRIVRDEEWGDVEEPEDADARITLEQLADGLYTVTVNLYGGWLQETARFDEEGTAITAYQSACNELAQLADLIPDEETRDMERALTLLNDKVAVFMRVFGGEPTL